MYIADVTSATTVDHVHNFVATGVTRVDCVCNFAVTQVVGGHNARVTSTIMRVVCGLVCGNMPSIFSEQFFTPWSIDFSIAEHCFAFKLPCF